MEGATTQTARADEGGRARRFGADVVCSRLAGAPLLSVVQPANEAHAELDALLAWAHAHVEEIDRCIGEDGGLLLRGFAVDETTDFERVSDLFPAYEMGYEAGATARARIAGKVYEATRVPAEVWIMLHQEMAYLPTFPSKLAFYCKAAPPRGGETTIGDIHAFTRRLPPRLMETLTEQGVQYTRNFRSPDNDDGRSDPVFNHRTWVEGFYTDDRRTVEQSCDARGLEYVWLPDGSITTWNTLPGVARHRRAGDVVYFNQLHTQTPHWRWMGEEQWARYRSVYTAGVARPYDACFGDGTPLTDDDILAIYDALDAVTVSFPWQHGDVLLIDNVHTGHGRNPYVGHRDVQVALFA